MSSISINHVLLLFCTYSPLALHFDQPLEEARRDTRNASSLIFTVHERLLGGAISTSTSGNIVCMLSMFRIFTKWTLYR